jgi:hypothetical protein
MAKVYFVAYRTTTKGMYLSVSTVSRSKKRSMRSLPSICPAPKQPYSMLTIIVPLKGLGLSTCAGGKCRNSDRVRILLFQLSPIITEAEWDDPHSPEDSTPVPTDTRILELLRYLALHRSQPGLIWGYMDHSPSVHPIPSTLMVHLSRS